MRAAIRTVVLLVVLAGIVVGAVVLYAWTRGLSARAEPGSIETFAARRIRDLAVARQARSLVNPVQRSPEVIAAGMAHFADHCASCHANDGSGNTTIGRGLYPRAPDMRLPGTQELSDGELFWIIENGIRFTGMPGWSTGEPDGEDASWHLVHFIRYLPNLTPDDLKRMEALNPRSPDDIRQEMEEEEFLSGGARSAPTSHSHPGGRNE